MVKALNCFNCNKNVAILPCPATGTENVTVWKVKFNAYKNFQKASSCQIVIKPDGSTFAQVISFIIFQSAMFYVDMNIAINALIKLFF